MSNPPAFPLPYNDQTGGQFGMSLRDYFAAASLTGIKSNNVLLKWIMDIAQEQDKTQQELIARMAYTDADEMLKAREKGGVS